jgi:uncharacterized SAM-binding protein YcdF (DUF218 family)
VPTASRSDSSWRRITLQILVGTLCLATLFLALTVRLFIRPPFKPPKKVDAVVFLSGDYGERVAKSVELINEGVADTLVHAGMPDLRQTVDLCSGGKPFEVVCLQPNPDSTRAEARAVAKLSSIRGWRSIAVVTSTPHVARASLLFRRCMEGEVRMVPAQPPLSHDAKLRFVLREWAKLIHALILTPRC